MKSCIEMHRQRPVWVLQDPAGIAIAGFAWSIMIISLFALWLSLSYWLGIFSFWGMLETVALTSSVGMCMWSHYMVMTTEPGFVPIKTAQGTDMYHGPSSRDFLSDEEGSGESEHEEEDIEMPLSEFEDLEDDGSLFVFCDDCNMYRPTRAIHCNTCERCVILMDHHCPWVNNCVGVGNQRYFLQFLFYVTVSSVHVIVLVLTQWWTCSNGVAFCGFDSGEFPGRLGMWLLAASCVFGLFCLVMLAMEVSSIDDDPVYGNISAKLNVRIGCKSSSRVERHLSVIFGTNGYDWGWLLPLPHRRNQQDWAIIGGFRVRNDAARGDKIC